MNSADPPKSETSVAAVIPAQAGMTSKKEDAAESGQIATMKQLFDFAFELGFDALAFLE